MKQKNDLKIRVNKGELKGGADVLCVAILDPDEKYFSQQGELGRKLKEAQGRLAPDGKPQEAFFRSWSGEGIDALLIYDTREIRHLPKPEKLKTIGARAYEFACKYRQKKITFILNGTDGAKAAGAVAEGCLLRSYRFDKYKSDQQSEKKVSQLEFVVRPQDEKNISREFQRLEIINEAMRFCRDLVNEPPSSLYPDLLARRAREMAQKFNLECEILNERELEKQGYLGVYTVGKGTPRKPRMITLRYAPKGRSEQHLVLVGKAVTFDTGGYSIKPAKDMWHMKGDMSGGAAIIATMMAVARLKPPLKVTAIIPSAQNSIDGNAMLPGDVITTKIGKTVHVDNTDAEGRLLLMDALIRGKEEGATHMVDLATLTGSVVRALGTSISGVFGTDQTLVEQIIAAGRRAGEDFWQLPLYDEYSEMLRNKVADLNNTGKSPNAGAITAALFLKEFVDPDIPWAHLDIAGTFLTEKKWKYFTPGATGVGVRTLIEFIGEFSGK